MPPLVSGGPALHHIGEKAKERIKEARNPYGRKKQEEETDLYSETAFAFSNYLVFDEWEKDNCLKGFPRENNPNFFGRIAKIEEEKRQREEGPSLPQTKEDLKWCFSRYAF